MKFKLLPKLFYYYKDLDRIKPIFFLYLINKIKTACFIKIKKKSNT